MFIDHNRNQICGVCWLYSMAINYQGRTKTNRKLDCIFVNVHGCLSNESTMKTVATVKPLSQDIFCKLKLNNKIK